MDQKSLKKLEYYRVIDRLSEYCSFKVSREMAQALLPVSDSYQAAALLNETTEAREILRLNPLFSLGGLWDIRSSLHQLEIGGVLEPEALVNLAAMCRAARIEPTCVAFSAEPPGRYAPKVPAASPAA